MGIHPFCKHMLWGTMLGCMIILLFAGCGSSTDRSVFGQPVTGVRVYDRAGVLTPTDSAMLEAQAQALTQAGATTIVYLRIMESSVDETIQDAQHLMTLWGVESAPGARDGFVVLVNLRPDDHAHGNVGLYAGQKYYQGGHLDQRELQRIIDDVMNPLLKDGKIASGIGAGLTAAQHSLSYGPPPPGQAQTTAALLARIPLNALAALIGVWVLVVIALARRGRPMPREDANFITVPPDTLPPAIAGALADRRVSDAQIAATQLELIARGALQLAPQGKRGIRLRLVDASLLQADYEQELWKSLERHAKDGVLNERQLGLARNDWKNVRQTLKQDLIARGWFDPEALRFRPQLLFLAIFATLVWSGGIVLAAIGHEIWGLSGILIALAASIAAYIVAGTFPETTPSGEAAGASWRAYKRGLRAADRTPATVLDLDTAVPFALALGTIGALTSRLKAAGKTGYTPIWMGAQFGGSDFFPFWGTYYAVGAAASDGGASGAAAGGGGAGGSF